ncbi:MAG: ABC transporter ATP-binding protein [Oscillospiraceae bacterium]
MSFRTRPGQLVAVLGPNGAGKSTLFRCILGFLPRVPGEIALCGHDLRLLDRRSLARLAAYIPQSSAPVYNYTVRDTVLMGADPFHAPGPSQQETADRVLETLGIRDLADRGINEISGGERQLALIARAMAQQAKILLMDEPTASPGLRQPVPPAAAGASAGRQRVHGAAVHSTTPSTPSGLPRMFWCCGSGGGPSARRRRP